MIPFLMFEGKAGAALTFYVSVVPNSRIVDVRRYGPEGPGAVGSVMKATFVVGRLTVMCTDSPVRHEFTFTPSTSLFVMCSSEGQLDALANALGNNGNIFMPPGNYGFSRKFTWLNDRFGVSWQLNWE